MDKSSYLEPISSGSESDNDGDNGRGSGSGSRDSPIDIQQTENPSGEPHRLWCVKVDRTTKRVEITINDTQEIKLKCTLEDVELEVFKVEKPDYSHVPDDGTETDMKDAFGYYPQMKVGKCTNVEVLSQKGLSRVFVARDFEPFYLGDGHHPDLLEGLVVMRDFLAPNVSMKELEFVLGRPRVIGNKAQTDIDPRPLLKKQKTEPQTKSE
jgi:hypothetical protein